MCPGEVVSRLNCIRRFHTLALKKIDSFGQVQAMRNAKGEVAAVVAGDQHYPNRACPPSHCVEANSCNLIIAIPPSKSPRNHYGRVVKNDLRGLQPMQLVEASEYEAT